MPCVLNMVQVHRQKLTQVPASERVSFDGTHRTKTYSIPRSHCIRERGDQQLRGDAHHGK